MPNKRTGFVILAAFIAAEALTIETTGSAQTAKTLAQKVVEDVKAAHPEITGLEVAATRTASKRCKTIAATEANEVGQACDKDELTAIKTNKAFVEKEKDEFDVTLPLHDSTGQIIATAGMDFKFGPGRS